MTNENFEKLMENWEGVLESYGVPGDFADSTYLNLIENPENPQDILIRLIIAPSRAKRGELMEKQRKEADERIAQKLPPRWTNDSHPSCFLCDNVGQAQDIGNNLLLPFNTYQSAVVLPNKYAHMRGHILLVSKNHDPDGKKIRITVTESYLENLIQLSGENDLMAFRNHAKAGMIIPNHEHSHLIPRKIKSNGKEIYADGLMDCELIATDYGEDIFSVDRTRFATLAFRGIKAVEPLLNVLNRLEDNNEIFTFTYNPSVQGDFNNGIFFVTPHAKQCKGTSAGAGGSSYCVIETSDLQVTYNDKIKFFKENLPLKNKFKWDNYFS